MFVWYIGRTGTEARPEMECWSPVKTMGLWSAEWERLNSSEAAETNSFMGEKLPDERMAPDGLEGGELLKWMMLSEGTELGRILLCGGDNDWRRSLGDVEGCAWFLQSTQRHLSPHCTPAW